ncbi:RnfABCDGE type electron transport complex subunit G [Candidatus Acetothermia bacterium]|jgi:electron transport complex protein RnfG|nr:RnfABCDGE type electron transport complex subunit G [Candidatus Acetothermia bacterium]MCI2427650.1 RnfABCDGE type electron transport complex subunit G [Candidatus Acetothermia bacterium]MCI2428833.1 RnfABCDGE type electron transport complex subunit G [Candidatus Acetothermia bacterium]
MIKRSRGSFTILFFLTLIVFLSVVSLFLTDDLTEERIAFARQAAIKRMLTALFPEMEIYDYDDQLRVYKIFATGKWIGQVFMVRASGYGGPIDIMVGLEPDYSLRGIRILSHRETPGLGDRITEAAFLDRFVGLTVQQIALTRDGGKIEGITAATISVRAVVDKVREAIIAKIDKEK